MLVLGALLSMFRQFAFYSSRLHILTVCLLAVLCLPLLSLLPPVTAKVPAAASTKEQVRQAAYVDDGPNVVSSGLFAGAAELRVSIDRAGARAERALYMAALTSYNFFRAVGKVSAHYGGVVVRATGAGIVFVAQGVIDGVVFVARLPVRVIGAVTSVPAVSAYVRPAEDMAVSEISYTEAVLAAEESVLGEEQGVAGSADEYSHSEPQHSSASRWPLRGQVTTLFGVPHWPFQPTHSGIDISSGNASGVSAIRPFRAGVVIEVVRSQYGLGNHVVVDHGEGLTSVYAHLASTSVETGQEVDLHSVLGFEGSTGTSTGTHLHFEIRQDGQPINPQQFLSIQP